MVSDSGNNDKIAKANLTEDQKTELARRSLKKEIDQLLTQEAKWSQEKTIYDKLPPHERPFSIQPFENERQRLPFKMTDEDRLRRKQWVHSQELTDREPVRVPELERMVYNPIRRLYRLPTDRLIGSLAPIIGENRVPFARFIIPKLFLGYVAGCVLWYNIKYNKALGREKGFSIVRSNEVILPGEERPKSLNKWDYADNGFQSRKAFKGSEYAY